MVLSAVVIVIVKKIVSGLAAAFKPPADPSGNGSDSPGLNLRTSLLNRLVVIVVLVMVTLR